MRDPQVKKVKYFGGSRVGIDHTGIEVTMPVI